MASALEKPTTIAGVGQLEWVWSAICAGEIAVLRAVPAGFDISSTHPKYGSVLTALLPGLLNLQGRFFSCDDRTRRALEIIAELGRRGARPDTIIYSANIKVESLYKEWHLVGDVTPLQVVIQMRDDLLEFSVQPGTTDEREEGATKEARMLDAIIDAFAELVAQAGHHVARVVVPEAVVNIWEQCLRDKEGADIAIICLDGETRAHSFLLTRSSPVLSAMLGAGMCETARREVRVQQPVHVVELLLTLVHTGCLPQEPAGESPEMQLNIQVVVAVAFMSNSAKRVLLPSGLEGEVQEMDSHGDALIKFDGIPTRQWVWKKNFVKLSTKAADSVTRLRRDLAGALALAHYWQIDGLAEVLAERLQRNICTEDFEAVLECAVMHGFSQLRAACLAFAQHSATVRAVFQAGEYNEVVLSALRLVLGRGAIKRPRESL